MARPDEYAQHNQIQTDQNKGAAQMSKCFKQTEPAVPWNQSEFC